MIKAFIVLMLLAILSALGSAFFRLVRSRPTDGSVDTGVVRALTIRIVLSVILFALLMAGFYFGIIPPNR